MLSMLSNNKIYTLYGFKDFGNKKCFLLYPFLKNGFIPFSSFSYFFNSVNKTAYHDKKYIEKRRELFNLFLNQSYRNFNTSYLENKEHYYIFNDIKNITPRNREANILFFLKTVCFLYIFKKAIPNIFNDEFVNLKAIKTIISVNKEKDNDILSYKEISIKTVLEKFEKLLEETKLDPVFFHAYNHVTFNVINSLFYDILVSKLYNHNIHKFMNLEDLEEKLDKNLVYNPEVEKIIKNAKKLQYKHDSILNASILFSKENHDLVFSNICYLSVNLFEKLGDKIANYDDIILLTKMKSIYDFREKSSNDEIKQIFSNEKNKKIIKVHSTNFYDTFLFLFKKNSMENFYDFLVSVTGMSTGIMEKTNENLFLAKSNIQTIKKIIDFYNSL